MSEKDKARPEASGEEAEPSMEEILTSIRRIIASDEEEGTAARQDEGEEVLELTDVVEESAPAQEEPAGKAPAPAPAPEPAAEAEAAPAPAAATPEAEAAGEVKAEGEPTSASHLTAEDLLSPAAAAAAAGAFARLTRQVAKPEPEPAVPGGERTVEAFLAELLRPMLKAWLDEHLPAIVERVVEREVQKLARRAEML